MGADALELVRDVVSWVCLGAGSLVVLATGISILRLPTFYARVHGTSISETFGAGLILIGLAVQAGPSLIALKLLLVLAFLALTSPSATHALAQAAYLHGLDPHPPELDAKLQKADAKRRNTDGKKGEAP